MNVNRGSTDRVNVCLYQPAQAAVTMNHEPCDFVASRFWRPGVEDHQTGKLVPSKALLPGLWTALILSDFSNPPFLYEHPCVRILPLCQIRTHPYFNLIPAGKSLSLRLLLSP